MATIRYLAQTSVTIADAFWAPRRDAVRTRSLPHQERELRAPGAQFDALRLTWTPGQPEPHVFWESDVAKWIEAASYALATRADPDLERSVDDAIELLAGAQQDDGYLNVYFTVVRPGRRFTDLRDAHELYCAGHLIEAGVAHHQATGKTTLLDVVMRYADLIEAEFSPGGSCEGGYCGHPEIELALVRLADASGRERYRALAQRIIDARGTRPFYFDAETLQRGDEGYFGAGFPHRPQQVERFRQYCQAHLPVAAQRAAVGHAVRAMYLYSAMTDLAIGGREDLRPALAALWDDVTAQKMYVTGGIGSDHSIEGFGPAYDLPSGHAYCETCAAIGLVMWAQRMFALDPQARYLDVMERALYNGVLVSASADGTAYFYSNVLASNGTGQRAEWFGCACCPPNLARLLLSLEHYAYAVDQALDTAYVNLFIAGSARFSLGDSPLHLEVATSYPDGGEIEITVLSRHPRCAVAVRIPDWAVGVTASLNDQRLDPDPGSFLRIDRAWTPGDRIRVCLPMVPRRTWASPLVAEDRGRVALQRGPIMYCVEGVDHEPALATVSLPRGAALRESADLDSELPLIEADAVTARAVDQTLYTDRPPAEAPTRLLARPYYSWANRGPTPMLVWVPEQLS